MSSNEQQQQFNQQFQYQFQQQQPTNIPQSQQQTNQQFPNVHQPVPPPNPPDVSIADQSQQFALAALANQLQDAMGGGPTGVQPVQQQQQQPQMLSMTYIPQQPQQQPQQQQQLAPAGYAMAPTTVVTQNQQPAANTGQNTMITMNTQQSFLVATPNMGYPAQVSWNPTATLPSYTTYQFQGVQPQPVAPTPAAPQVVGAAMAPQVPAPAPTATTTVANGTNWAGGVPMATTMANPSSQLPPQTTTTTNKKRKANNLKKSSSAARVSSSSSGSDTKSTTSSSTSSNSVSFASQVLVAPGNCNNSSTASVGLTRATRPVHGSSKQSLLPSSLASSARSSTSSSVPKSSRGTSRTSNSARTKAASGSSSLVVDDPGSSSGSQQDRVDKMRERNREHAKSTRLRKKAYVQKLKEMAEGLRAVQSEEVRQRRVAVERLSEIQKVRKSVVQTFLQYHANFEPNVQAWKQILVDDNEETNIFKISHLNDNSSDNSMPPQPRAVQLPSIGTTTMATTATNVGVPPGSSSSASATTTSTISMAMGGDGSSTASSTANGSGSTNRDSGGGTSDGSGSSGFGFTLKLPVTPFRWFRPSEVQRDYRMVHGIEAVIADSASMSVMVERIGHRNARWQNIKRKRFLHGREDIIAPTASENEAHAVPDGSGSRRRHRRRRERRRRKEMQQQAEEEEAAEETDYQSNDGSNNAMSSLSSSASESSTSYSSSNNSGGEDRQDRRRQRHRGRHESKKEKRGAKKRDDTNAIEETDGLQSPRRRELKRKESSKDDLVVGDREAKRQKPQTRTPQTQPEECSDISCSSPGNNNNTGSNKDTKTTNGNPKNPSSSKPSVEGGKAKDNEEKSKGSGITPFFKPAKIAKSGGIVHNVRPMFHDLSRSTAAVVAAVAPPTNAGASYVPPVPVPVLSNQNLQQPGHGTSHQQLHYIGPDYVRRRPVVPAVILNDPMGSTEEVGAYYSINEDDMIVMDDILMCPFVFRSKNAVLSGALADCVMPGMLRAQFSTLTNKLTSVEMIYDAMGFMQQLDRANGGEITAQIIPGSLEMALMHTPHEARVVTEAKAPYCVVHVNECWTKMTKYDQIEVEGQELWSLLQGENTVAETRVRPGKPSHKLDDVARGLSACSTNFHYDKNGKPFVDFMCSYPLTNADDQITHLLHVHKELPKAHSLIRDL